MELDYDVFNVREKYMLQVLIYLDNLVIDG